MDNILLHMKKSLGIDLEYDGFDTELVMHINSAFMVLNQVGIGPSEGFSITGMEEVWSDFISSDDLNRLGMIKNYIYISLRLLFDPPSNSYLLTAFENQKREMEWRLRSSVEDIEEVL